VLVGEPLLAQGGDGGPRAPLGRIDQAGTGHTIAPVSGEVDVPHDRSEGEVTTVRGVSSEPVPHQPAEHSACYGNGRPGELTRHLTADTNSCAYLHILIMARRLIQAGVVGGGGGGGRTLALPPALFARGVRGFVGRTK